MTPTNRVEAKILLGEFQRGEIELISLPAWVLAGKRCLHRNGYGQCREAVLGNADPDKKGDFCYYHTKFPNAGSIGLGSRWSRWMRGIDDADTN